MAAANGADAYVPPPPAGAPDAENTGGFKLKFCTVCASNQNRCVVYAFIIPLRQPVHAYPRRVMSAAGVECAERLEHTRSNHLFLRPWM